MLVDAQDGPAHVENSSEDSKPLDVIEAVEKLARAAHKASQDRIARTLFAVAELLRAQQGVQKDLD